MHALAKAGYEHGYGYKKFSNEDAWQETIDASESGIDLWRGMRLLEDMLSVTSGDINWTIARGTSVGPAMYVIMTSLIGRKGRLSHIGIKTTSCVTLRYCLRSTCIRPIKTSRVIVIGKR